MPTPGIIEYPAALDTALSLIEVNNNASDTLTGNISVSDLLIPVANPGKFSQSGFVTLVDSLTTPTKIEIVLYTSKSGSNLVVPPGGRGVQGTTAQAFSTGHFVEQRPTARHHTALADLLIAIEQKLGIGVDTPGAAIEALMSNGAGASQWRGLTGADVANVVRKDDAALQAIISDLTISKSQPLLRWTHTGLSKNFIAIINGIGQLVIGEEGLSNAIVIDPVTGVVTFEEVPFGPAANPTFPNQLARKEYVDTKKIWWSMNWFIADPSTFPLNTFSQVQKVCIPAGSTSFRAQFGRGIFSIGIASGSFTVEIRKHPFGNQAAQTTIGTIAFNPGTGGVGQGSVLAIDHTFTPDDWVYIILTAASSPAQRDVTISLQGFQFPT
jgi:hypothetical protein